MMSKLDEKRDLIEKYGFINNMQQTQLIPASQAFSYKYLLEIFEKLNKILNNAN